MHRGSVDAAFFSIKAVKHIARTRRMALGQGRFGKDLKHAFEAAQTAAQKPAQSLTAGIAGTPQMLSGVDRELDCRRS